MQAKDTSEQLQKLQRSLEPQVQMLSRSFSTINDHVGPARQLLMKVLPEMEMTHNRLRKTLFVGLLQKPAQNEKLRRSLTE